MYIALISIIIFISVLLILVVLSQNSKGGGLSNQFGAGSSNLIGVKRTGDLLEKMTWGLAIGLVILALSANMLVDKNAGGVPGRSATQQRASQQSAAPAAAPVIPQTTPPAGGQVVPQTAPPAGAGQVPSGNKTTPVIGDTLQR